MDPVRVASDGEEGLALLQQQRMDLVLLDLVLPGMGGLPTCRQITATEATPVLLLTSQDDPQWVQQIWEAGARGYLHKERAFAQVELALVSLQAGASWWDDRATAILQGTTLTRKPWVADLAAHDPCHGMNTFTQREREARCAAMCMCCSRSFR